jgi:UDP-N-acetylmuramyl tripeptide synthase
LTAFSAKRAAARTAARASRLTGRGGTSLPGHVLLRLEPAAITRLAADLPQGSAVISATNGKTTTAALAHSIFTQAGIATVENSAGANMAAGVAAALLQPHPGAQLGLFEVDEFWLPTVTAQLHPRTIVLANLFRDQLDRYGELETIGERWAGVAGAATDSRLVLGADDPLVADLGRTRADTLYFGIEDPAAARSAGLAHAADSKQCRRCGAAYRYERVYVGHLGHYACPACGQRRPAPQVSAHDILLDGVRGARFELRTPAGAAIVSLALPGLYNVYNALAAAALATSLEIPLAAIAAGLDAAAAAFGRAERVTLAGGELQILLVKNPAGADEILRTLALDTGDWQLLAALNDQIADGRDVSWIWDADFESFADRIAHVTCTGTRAPELALRFKYAGVPTNRIAVESDLAAALDAALARAAGTTLYALPTYTAMLALRELLRRRGQAASSWAAK